MIKKWSVTALMIFIVNVFVGCGGGASGGNPPVVLDNNHPRIWIDTSTLTELRLKAANNTAQWQAFKAYLDANLKNTDTAGYQGSVWYHDTISYALGYQVLKTSDPATAAIYAEQALKYANAMSHDSIVDGAVGSGGGGDTSIQVDSGWAARTIGLGLAVAYDWLYDYPGFNTATKTEFKNRLNAWIAWYDASGYDRTRVGSNYYMGYFIMKALAGYALDSAKHTGNANNMWDNLIVPLFNVNLIGGDYHGEGWNYGLGVGQKLAGYLLARKTATGVDDSLVFTWGLDHISYKISALHPTKDSVYGGGRWSGDYAGYVSDRDVVYWGRAYRGTTQGTHYEWYKKHLVNMLTSQDAEPWETFLFYNPLIDNQLDYTLTAPIHYRAAGNGFIGMRSSWYDTATHVAFRAGGHGLGNWQDAEQGHFEIFKNSFLAVNAGMWSRDGLSVYQEIQSSDYRNVMYIDDLGTGYMTYRGLQIPGSENNDPFSGQTEVSQVKYEGATNYVYVDADLKGAYKSARNQYPATYYHRQLFYLRPDYVIIADRLTTQSANFKKAWLLHWAGTTMVVGRTASGTYGTGKMQFASLAPMNVTITTAPDVVGHTTSLTRMIVTAADNNASELFLNAIRATTSSDSSVFIPTKVIATDNKMVGVKIAGTSKDYYVMFSGGIDNTVVNGTISYPYNSVNPSEHYLVDLPENTTYSVVVSGGIITFTPGSGSYTSSSNGILYFQ